MTSDGGNILKLAQPASARARGDDDVEIWKVRLNRESSEVSTLFETLSVDEQRRANAFRFVQDRNRYVVTRGMLRKIIGGYLNTEPAQISFSYNRFGKPALDPRDHPLRFNVSHSRGLALIAITSGREVGIDVEFIDNDLDVLATANGVFPTVEVSVLQALAPDIRTRSFFKGWTRQEAYLKAQGRGFSGRTGQLPFLLLKDEPKFTFRAEYGQIRQWSLISLHSDPKFSAALVVEGNLGSIQIKQHQAIN